MTTPHSLPPMSLHAASALRVVCPVHDAPATGCVTSVDQKTHIAKLTFACGCTAVARVQ